MFEVNSYYLKWRRVEPGISARENKVVLYSVVLCCIYWRYTGDQGWRNGGRTRFPTVWRLLKIVLESKSELVKFVGSVLYSAPKGFRPALPFALKTSMSYFELI